jgi:hypothetical protein
MASWESEDLSPDVREQFWQNLIAFENAPWTTDFQLLTDAGVELPEPDALNDEELTAKLWEVIDRLAGMHVYLSDTDHLSDRELYRALWHDSLREEVKAIEDPNSAYHLSLVGSFGPEQLHAYLKYYADEDERRRSLEDFPDEELPPHEDPPFDRDRLLPQRPYPRRATTSSAGPDPN